MKIEIVAKNYQVNEKLADIVDKKVAKLNKYFDDDTKCKIYFKKENRTYKMEVELFYKGNLIRAQAYAGNFYDAIDLVLPKIERQIYKHRSKLETKLRKGAFVEATYKEEDLTRIRLVKTKQFNLEPMSIAEAMDEFELLGHSFYVFLDKDADKVKVLYQRDDGNVGLIDPIV